MSISRERYTEIVVSAAKDCTTGIATFKFKSKEEEDVYKCCILTVSVYNDMIRNNKVAEAFKSQAV